MLNSVQEYINLLQSTSINSHDQESLKYFSIRTARSIYTYSRKIQSGYVFANKAGKRNILVTPDILEKAINSPESKLPVTWGGSAFWGSIDRKELEHDIEREAYKQQQTEYNKQKTNFREYAINSIQNDDPDFLFYCSLLNHDPEITPGHKAFIMAVREKRMDYIRDLIQQAYGYNMAGKKVFEKMTGIQLPKTEKGIKEVLDQWCLVSVA